MINKQSIVLLLTLLLTSLTTLFANQLATEPAMPWKHPLSAQEKQKRISQLTPLQQKVTQEDGTEKPFDNAYWDNKQAGIYVDVVSGEPLFSSRDKFESGTGWPSFTKPIDGQYIVEKVDRKLFFASRTEIRSKQANSHLGHVFPDGPKPTGLRYCMNSAALRFIPVAELTEQGYGAYRYLFDVQ